MHACFAALLLSSLALSSVAVQADPEPAWYDGETGSFLPKLHQSVNVKKEKTSVRQQIENAHVKFAAHPKYLQPSIKKTSSRVITVDAGDDASEYIAEVTVGTPGQKLKVKVDSGTPVFWVKGTFPKKEYGYSKRSPAIGGFDAGASSTFLNDDVAYDLEYSSGTKISGTLVRDKVELGGLKVKSTFVLVPDEVNVASSQGDLCGVFGLSLPKKDSEVGASWLRQAVESGQCEPVFGFLPPTNETYGYGNDAQSARFEVCGTSVKVSDSDRNEITEGGLQSGIWSVDFKGFKYGSKDIPLSDPQPVKKRTYPPPPPAVEVEAIIDTGSTYFIFPKCAVDTLHNLLDAECPTAGYASPSSAGEADGTSIGGKSPEAAGLCRIKCKKRKDLTFLLGRNEYTLTGEEWVVTDEKGDCYSPFTTWKGNADSAGAVASGETRDSLAVIGTVFQNGYASIFFTGYESLGLTPPVSRRSRLSRRQGLASMWAASKMMSRGRGRR